MEVPFYFDCSEGCVAMLALGGELGAANELGVELRKLRAQSEGVNVNEYGW
jgi:hypothetical protein